MGILRFLTDEDSWLSGVRGLTRGERVKETERGEERRGEERRGEERERMSE